MSDEGMSESANEQIPSPAFFKMHFKNIDQNNICASTVFKAKTEEEKNN